jgi:hypothetical protein
MRGGYSMAKYTTKEEIAGIEIVIGYEYDGSDLYIDSVTSDDNLADLFFNVPKVSDRIYELAELDARSIGAKDYDR